MPQALLLQLSQSFAGGGHLPVSFGIAQVQAPAKVFGQTVAAGRRLLLEEGEH